MAEKRTRFNRYDALLDEMQRLQLSKLKLLQSTSTEMQKLRSLIRFLCKVDNMKQISAEILIEIDKFNQKQTDSNNTISDDLLLESIKSQSNASLNFIDLQQEIKKLRQSKFELINSTNNQINSMRDTIKLLTNRISLKINPHKSKDNEQKINTNYKEETLLHNYMKLGKDNVVNIVLFGTKCSGKTTLLRHIVSIFDNKNKHSLFERIKNIKNMIIHSIVFSIYSVLFEHDFFKSSKYQKQLKLSQNMQQSIEYFEKNHLSHYSAPFLSQSIAESIHSIFDNFNDHSNDDHFVRLVFMNHCFYKNYAYFYQNIDKFTKPNWLKHFSTSELLLIWDQSTLPIYFYDIQLGEFDDTIYRFWDISSDVLYDANTKFKHNLRSFMDCINVSCILYLTSPIFAYQIEKSANNQQMDETSMTKSIKYFQAMFAECDEYKNENDDILKRVRSIWRLVPLITLFNKCDVFRMDMECEWDETKSILLSFAEYDGEQSYDAIMDYLKIIFKSLNVSHKRPFHIYETTLMDAESVRKIVHHIKTMTNLYTMNKKLASQMNTNYVLATV